MKRVICEQSGGTEICIDNEMELCTSSQTMIACSGSELRTYTEREERGVNLDSAISDNNDLLQPLVEAQVKDAVDVTELKSCSGTQENGRKKCATFEFCTETNAHEVMTSTEPGPFTETKENGTSDEHCTKNTAHEDLYDVEVKHEEVMNDLKMEPCTANHAMEVHGAPCDFVLEPFPKDKVEEASNDDVHSEVSNPNLFSPKHVTSCLTINSQIHDVLGCDHGGYGEITSACSQNFRADQSFCGEKQNLTNTPESVSTSVLAREIPKHVSTTGIRKITFKFSKRKEEYDNHFPDIYPRNVKKLLSTKILEGAKVKYISVSGEKEILGIIKDCGYVCGCSLCNFSKVVSAYEFEFHAGAKTRHPNNHVYLENGNPIYNIIQELRTAPLSALDQVIRAVAGSSVNEEYFKIWKASLQVGNEVAYADDGCQRNNSGVIVSYPSQPVNDHPCPDSCHIYEQENLTEEAPVESKHLIKKPRHSISGVVSEQKKASEGGSGTKKRDNDLHKLLFMPNGLPDGTDLAYYARGKKILGGFKQGNGIVCNCCHTEISPSQFEAHAGCAAKRQPYRHIYTSNGLTLHDIALMLANGQKFSTSGSDDMCSTCGGGGELIICNGCPRAFHTACLGLQCVPADDWHCTYCKDKFVPGRKVSCEPRHIILRLTRVVKAPEIETGGCVLCRSQEFSAATFDDLTVIICDQCEKEYHVGCLRDRGFCDLKELPKNKWFCCDECNGIFARLQILASTVPEAIPISVSEAIHRKYQAKGINDGFNEEIQWRILSGKSRSPEHLLLLSRAAAIFRERFDPIVIKSGRDLIPVMVYGRNISGQEFSGMYCVVLIVKSVVVSAALLRIFGREVAELPLVATSRENQGKGYFLALFSCIEELLLSLNVKHIVLPAAEDAEPMWTKRLGFSKTSQDQMLKYTRDLQLTMFKCTALLEKEIQKPPAD